MHLDEQQLIDNWKALMKIIDDEFSGERQEKLKTM